MALSTETREDLLRRAHELVDQRRVDDAILLFNEAEFAECDPDLCAAGRWNCHMLNGDFESAWRESDFISRRGKPDPNRYWNGEPLEDKRVLIRCLHGLGDTIQFIRYAPLVRAIAHSVAIEAQPALVSLLAASGLADRVFTWGEREPAWDAQVEVIELPRIFRTTLDTIPHRVPYLRAPAAALPRNAAPRIGVVWSASSYNPARSVPPEQISPLFDVPGANVFSLQFGPERLALDAPALCGADTDILTTAALVSQLDLVITVDTMMAHLAGALAIPVWTLLCHQSDWRWMLARDDSPWYPTMRLVRQSTPGDWRSTIKRVRADLLALAGAWAGQCEEKR